MAYGDGDEMDTYHGRVITTTGKAVLFYVEDVEEEVWFPLSVIELDENGKSLDCPRWLARQRGLL